MLDRNYLDKIIEEAKGDWWSTESFKEKVCSKLPKELEVLSLPPEEQKNYNCFLYVLGLHQEKTILKESRGFIYYPFIQKMIREGFLKEIQAPVNGDYVMYKDLKNYPNNITHAGVIDGDKIISKWAWGPLVRHDLFDVPQTYGNQHFYIKSVDRNEAVEFYKKYKFFNKLN